MISVKEAQELHELIGVALLAQSLNLPAKALTRAREIASIVITDAESMADIRAFCESADVALGRLLKEPHGCAFCDSGELHNPNKPHEVDCGFPLAEAARQMAVAP